MTMTKRALDRATAASVERQMRRWALSQEIEKRLPPEEAADQLPAGVKPYVTISRQAGAGGGHVGTLVGHELGCPCLDRELLNLIAEKFNLSRGMLKHVDETTSDWMREIFGRWLDKRVVTQTEYIVHLSQAIMLAAREQPTVFVGRGARFLLPRDKGLAVRILAPPARRIERTMERRQLDRRAAEAYVEETDRTRRQLIQRYFHHDSADPTSYDLVINLEHLDHEGAAELIVHLYRRRFAS